MWHTYYNHQFGLYEACELTVFDFQTPQGDLVQRFRHTYDLNSHSKSSFGLFSNFGMVYVTMSDEEDLVDTIQVFLYAKETLNFHQNVSVKEFVAKGKEIGAPYFQAMPIIFAE